MNKLLVLAGKDIFLHWKALVGSWIGLCFAVLVLTQIRLPANDGEKAGLIMSFGIIMTMLYGQWLIDLEKTDRTFALMRTVPVSDASLVTSKFFSCVAMQTGCYLVPITFLLPYFVVTEGRVTVVLTWLFLVAMATTLMVGRWVLGPRIGQLVVGAFVVCVIGIVIWIRRTFGEAAIPREDPVFLTLFGFSLVAWMFLLWVLTCLWVRSRDTSDLMR